MRAGTHPGRGHHVGHPGRHAGVGHHVPAPPRHGHHHEGQHETVAYKRELARYYGSEKRYEHKLEKYYGTERGYEHKLEKVYGKSARHAFDQLDAHNAHPHLPWWDRLLRTWKNPHHAPADQPPHAKRKPHQ